MKRLSIEDINSKKPEKSRLTAIDFAPSTIHSYRKRRMVNVKCICGNYRTIAVTDIATGHSLSCGCFGNEQRMKKVKKYSKWVQGIYASYKSMIRRCYDKKSESYKYYGAKGVVVCEEWRNNYESFLQWSLNNGWRKGLHLDKDKLGDGKLYSPSTCEWMDNNENSKYKNSGRALMFEHGGKLLTLGEICKLEGLDNSLIYGRVKELGISLEYAIKLGNKRYKSYEIKEKIALWENKKNLNNQLKLQK